VLTEYNLHEMATATERLLWKALKVGTSSEVNSKKGGAQAEGLELDPSNCSEVGAPQVELNGVVREALFLKPPPQRPRRSCFSTSKSMTHFRTDRAAELVALFADIKEITCECVLECAIDAANDCS